LIDLQLQREAELEALSKEAEEEFTSAMLSNLKEKRFKESDLDRLLEPEKQQKTGKHVYLSFIVNLKFNHDVLHH